MPPAGWRRYDALGSLKSGEVYLRLFGVIKHVGGEIMDVSNLETEAYIRQKWKASTYQGYLPL